MSDSVSLHGQEYVSSKRASELSGYAQDYIGQLARKGLIEGQRMGGLWYVSMNSLSDYKTRAEAYVREQPESRQPFAADALISFDGKDHISASRAAQITGYHPDYVGQLARSGSVVSRQVGNRWYIDRDGLLAHKREKDSLLGGVQARSVGLARHTNEALAGTNDESAGNTDLRTYADHGPFLTYTRDDRDLLPVIGASKVPAVAEVDNGWELSEVAHPVPVHAVHTGTSHRFATYKNKKKEEIHTSGKTIFQGTFGRVGAAALTIVIVLSFGFMTLKDSSVYGTNLLPVTSIIHRNALPASAAAALQRIGGFLINFFTIELSYKRGN